MPDIRHAMPLMMPLMPIYDAAQHADAPCLMLMTRDTPCRRRFF